MNECRPERGRILEFVFLLFLWIEKAHWKVVSIEMTGKTKRKEWKNERKNDENNNNIQTLIIIMSGPIDNIVGTQLNRKAGWLVARRRYPTRFESNQSDMPTKMWAHMSDVWIDENVSNLYAHTLWIRQIGVVICSLRHNDTMMFVILDIILSGCKYPDCLKMVVVTYSRHTGGCFAKENIIKINIQLVYWVLFLEHLLSNKQLIGAFQWLTFPQWPFLDDILSQVFGMELSTKHKTSNYKYINSVRMRLGCFLTRGNSEWNIVLTSVDFPMAMNNWQ